MKMGAFSCQDNFSILFHSWKQIKLLMWQMKIKEIEKLIKKSFSQIKKKIEAYLLPYLTASVHLSTTITFPMKMCELAVLKCYRLGTTGRNHGVN